MEGTTIVSEAVSEVAPAVVTVVSSQGVKRCAGKFGPKIGCRIFSFCRGLWKVNKTVIVATVAVVALFKVHRTIKKRNCRKEWNSAGKNIVVLHSFPKATTLPNLSPFVLKLETYLRMADIQYKFDDRYPYGPKGKAPWITLNGKDYADSQLIIEFLGKEFRKDFCNSLSKEEKAVSRAMQIMAEEHVLFGLGWWRFVVDRCESMSVLMKLSFFEYLFMKSLIKKIRKKSLAPRLWAS
ncbi:Failed axon connections-like protein [Armadillidium nasatum]|uniref:Failed axon connections-like protein n=1 Tax=Armadillidium nasatum TaxID=96803 RepID=A0A5N5T2I7_9CRUS|nr:Failed axon connections-like protein [Armadillidium nasatum]